MKHSNSSPTPVYDQVAHSPNGSARRLSALLLFLFCYFFGPAIAQAHEILIINALNDSDYVVRDYVPTGGLSADGRYALFSPADDRLPGLNGGGHLYRRDLQTRATEQVTGFYGGKTPLANGGFISPGSGFYYSNRSISGNGRYVVFLTDSPELPGTGNNPTQSAVQLFRRDMLANRIEVVSAMDGSIMPAIAHAEYISSEQISADGRYVTFSSTAVHFPFAVQFKWQTYRRDMQTDRTELVNRADSDLSIAQKPQDISADGRYVLFAEYPNDSPNTNTAKIYRRDMSLPLSDPQSIILISAADDSSEPLENIKPWGKLSADGRYALFGKATNPSSSDSIEIYRRDIETRSTAIASAVDNCDWPTDSSMGANISGNGRYVSFVSIMPGFSDGKAQVFRRDMDTRRTILISSPDGLHTGKGNRTDFATTLSFDGNVLSFSSDSHNLITVKTQTGASIPDDLLITYAWRGTSDSLPQKSQVMFINPAPNYTSYTSLNGFFFPAAADTARPGSIFIAAYFPESVSSAPNTLWSMDSSGNWHLFTGCQSASAYLRGNLLPRWDFPILSGADITGAQNAELYIGYGLGNESDPIGQACEDMFSRQTITRVLPLPIN